MRYTKFREYLSRMNRDERMSRDGRNPYGSRGGYVRSDRARGRDYDRMGDMARDREHDGRDYNRDYNRADYEMDGRDREYDRQSSRDYARRVGYFDYDTDYAYDRGASKYDMRRDYGDYASEDYKLSKEEIKKWNKELGGKYSTEQIEQIAKQERIKFEEFSPELLTAITNMMASDYGKELNTDMATYVKMAKAFLCDEDFDGTPEEKAYLYYTAIVEKEEE